MLILRGRVETNKLQASLAGRAQILVVLTGSGALVGYTGSWYWFAELFSHFFIQYWVASLLAIIVLLWAGDKRWGAASVALLFVLSFTLAPYYLHAHTVEASAGKPNLRLFQFNAAQNPARVFDWLEQHAGQVDVVILLEANSDFQAGIDRIKAQFPYALTQLQDGPFGIALLSKYPLADTEVLDLVGEAFPALAATVAVPGWATPLQVYAIHPPPPVSSDLAELRNQYMKKLAAMAAARGSAPIIVAGDLNVTPWSPWFRDFIRTSQMHDSQRGLGLLATWPAATAQYSSFLGIPIDACLHSDKLQVATRALGPEIDSDHLPVITELRLR